MSLLIATIQSRNLLHAEFPKAQSWDLYFFYSASMISQMFHIHYSLFYLLTILVSFLTFERHIVYTKNKISKGLGIIIKARKYLNRESLLKLYNCFVFPYFTYCVEVWGNTAEKYLDPLIKVQKKIVRVITFSPYLSHTDSIFKDLNILPFSKLVTQRISVLMFKYSIHVLPNSIEDLFTSNKSINSYNTRLNQNQDNQEVNMNICIVILVIGVFISGINSKTILILSPAIVHLAVHSKPSFCQMI